MAPMKRHPLAALGTLVTFAGAGKPQQFVSYGMKNVE